ncbi:MAG TPA: peptidylprolyl isomerase [Candidatus Angelobacter sp.]|nr:peptidylprolyl isomerase [Candidatus Angelobacter sp.]
MLKKLSLSLAALLLLLAGAALRADIVDEIIARVNTSIITRADYERAKQTTQQELQQQSPNDWQAKWPDRQKEILRELIDRQLLLEKGKELGITGDTEVVKRLNQMRQQMNLPSMDALEEEAKKQGISFEDFKEQIRAGVVEEQVIGREVGSKIHISQEEVQDFYSTHQKEMEGSEEVSLSEIMVSTQPVKPAGQGADKNKTGADQPLPEDPAKVAEAEAKAKSLLEQLRKGAKFEDLAKANSSGPTAAEGGRLGNFKRGELAKEFEDKTFPLKPGEFSDVIRTKQGFIILKVNGHRAAGIPPLKDVEDNIRQAIYSQKLEPAARAYLTKLREQAYIDVKSGYVDTGASPNQSSKPVIMAAASSSGSAQGKQQQQQKKKKKFLVF